MIPENVVWVFIHNYMRYEICENILEWSCNIRGDNMFPHFSSIPCDLVGGLNPEIFLEVNINVY